ncbi:MAG: sterol desaturase family protein [Leptospiraceae bacterium]|nr:sterol desaturase family protein [Leptospiraceae bacterium]MCP5493377.1 sterol desaturase family protein [Leptospiraceae bacterium]
MSLYIKSQCSGLFECAIDYTPIFFLILVVRYLLISGGAFLIFWILLRRNIEHKRIQENYPKRRTVLNEIKWSILTFTIFGGIGSMVVWASHNGYTKVYRNFDEYGIAYFILSIVLFMILHDAYFYFSHRLMHTKFLFKKVHKVHHLSNNPTPWASFSFHPSEAVLEAGILPVFAFLFPYHPLALFVSLLIMSVMNALGHLGYEFYPKGFTKHLIGKWFNTSTHHNMHHSKVNCNYGLYFNWWDRIFQTNHSLYHETFEEVTSNQNS